MDKDDLARLALLASVMSTASDGIFSVDEEQLIISFNEGAQKTFGYRRGEIMGRPLGLLLPDDVLGIWQFCGPEFRALSE
jgi:PAS domain S-box-containing protein